MSARPTRAGWLGGFSTQARVLLAVVLVCAFVFPLFVLGAKYPDTFAFLLHLYHQHFDFSLPSARVYVDSVSVLLAVCLCATFVQYRRAMAREAALTDIINSISPDVLLVLGPDRRVVLCNRAVKRMLGYDESEVRGRECDFVVFAEPRALAAPPLLLTGLAAEGFRICSAEGKAKHGGSVPLEVIAGHLRGSEGKSSCCATSASASVPSRSCCQRRRSWSVAWSSARRSWSRPTKD